MLTAFEKGRYVYRESTVAEEHQGEQQSSDAPVAVNEGVNRFKLRVNDGSARQDAELVVALGIPPVPYEAIEIRHESRHLRWRRRYESSVFDPGSANEVLDVAKLSGRRVRASAHEVSVHLADQSVVQSALPLLLHLSNAQRVGAEIIQGLLGVRVADGIGSAHLELVQEQLIELSMRPFDLTAVDRLPSVEHVHEQLCITRRCFDSGREHL